MADELTVQYSLNDEGTYAISAVENGAESELSNSVTYTRSAGSTITDLTGTTWVLDDAANIEASSGFGSFAIDFELDGSQYDHLWVGYAWNVGIGLIQQSNSIVFGSEEDPGLNINNSDFDVGEPISVTFTGGTDATNATLISWLEANGTLTAPQPAVNVNLTTLANYSQLVGGTTYTIQIRALGVNLNTPSNLTSGISYSAPYPITLTSTHCNVAGQWYIASGGTVVLTIYPDTNYTLPETVSVTGASYVYSKANATVTISNPTGNVAVEINCPAIVYSISCSLTNCTETSGTSTITATGTATLTIVPNAGCILPDSVTVVGASYTWYPTGANAGDLVLRNPTANVSVTVVCSQQQLSSPTIALNNDIGTITNIDTRATDMKIYVDGNLLDTVSLNS